MTDPVVTRRIQCTQCGAAHQVLDDALIVMCEHCGAFVALHASEHWGGRHMAALHAEQLRSLVDPSWADARKMQAALGMSDAQAKGDRETWRLWAREYHAVLPTTDPALVIGDVDDPKQRARWARNALKAAELSAFDPVVQRAQQRYGATAGELYKQGDPIAAARRTLDEAESLYRTMYEHPEYPREFATGDPLHMGRELLRSTLLGAAAILGPGVTTRIRQEVLGDETTDGSSLSCGGCGSALPVAQGTQRCPYCGAVVDVATEDPWIGTMLGLWETSRGQSSDDAAEAFLSLTLGLSSYFTRRTLPPVEAMGRFLAAGPHWLSRSDLARGIELMRMGYDGDRPVIAWIEALEMELAHWVPTGTRPIALPERVPHPTPPNPAADPATDADTVGDMRSDPWVMQTLAIWHHNRNRATYSEAELATEVIGFVLSPFYLGGSISAAQALAFMNAVEPQPSRGALATAAELMLRAEASPAAAPMLSTLAAALRRSL